MLLIGGTGNVGGATARLLAGKHDVRVLTRSPEKARSQPRGITGVVGDLADPASLTEPLEGIERVFMVTPLVPDETELGLNGVKAAVEAAIPRMVYMSVFQADSAPEIPHFASKVPIERGLATSGIPYTILRPNSFFQNDLRLLDVLRNAGVYPEPVGPGINRVDVEDIAQAAVNALTLDGFEGRTLPVSGPEALTGSKIAEVWSKALGRPVRYTGDDLDGYCGQLKANLPESLARDLCLM
ncbi:MAG: SDR family oxidoreductase, partial [Gemmatimonadales bacterium]